MLIEANHRDTVDDAREGCMRDARGCKLYQPEVVYRSWIRPIRGDWVVLSDFISGYRMKRDDAHCITEASGNSNSLPPKVLVGSTSFSGSHPAIGF